MNRAFLCWRHLPIFLTVSVFLLIGSDLQAQSTNPKRELRGVWVATVLNIDFPSRPGLSAAELRNEWEDRVSRLADAGFNAVMFQVRPACDAFYASHLAPWSKYLTGTQGQGFEAVAFDPLEMLIEVAHSHGMEFHAWFNPYRASMDTSLALLSPAHPLRQHPEWGVRYGGRLYLDPGIPEVRNYVTEVVVELVMNYDVDAIHFDDYFYPYPAAGEVFPDEATFRKYGFGYATIEEWRRSNVDKLIAQVSAMLRRVAPQVKFGVAPFGVWRNQVNDPLRGSNTRSAITAYDDLYADVLHWLEKGWVDYVAPQLYWQIGYAPADYKTLLGWWHAHRNDRWVYPGMAAYKVATNPEPAWQSPVEIPAQIRLNRSLPGVGGGIFYSMRSVLANPLGLLDSLRNNYYRTPALPPEMTWMGLDLPPIPRLGKPKHKRGAVEFDIHIDNEEGAVRQLVVYRFEDRLPGDFNNPENILRIIPIRGEQKVTLRDENVEQGKYYTYAAATLNRQGSESILSEVRTVRLDGRKLRIFKNP